MPQRNKEDIEIASTQAKDFAKLYQWGGFELADKLLWT